MTDEERKSAEIMEEWFDILFGGLIPKPEELKVKPPQPPKSPHLYLVKGGKDE